MIMAKLPMEELQNVLLETSPLYFSGSTSRMISCYNKPIPYSSLIPRTKTSVSKFVSSVFGVALLFTPVFTSISGIPRSQRNACN
jgi:hypothetical protein